MSEAQCMVIAFVFVDKKLHVNDPRNYSPHNVLCLHCVNAGRGR